jgi:hypothetical protein
MVGVVTMAVCVALQGAGAAAPAARQDEAVRAWFDVRSDMGKNFRLVEVHLVLDGVPVADRVARKGEELERSFRAYEGDVTPGEHTLRVQLVLAGRNRGIFTYMDNYRYNVEGESLFVARGDGPAAVAVVAAERKGADVPIEKKPMIRFEPAPGSALANPAPQRR